MIDEETKQRYLKKACEMKDTYGNNQADDMIFGMVIGLILQGDYLQELEDIRRGCRPDNWAAL